MGGSPAASAGAATATNRSAGVGSLPSAPAIVMTPRPRATPSAEPIELELPSPSCPSPPYDGKEPVVTASVTSGDSVRVTIISSGVQSCSTVGVSDGVPTIPKSKLMARINDQLTLTLSSPWRLARWSGYERGTDGEISNVWPSTDTPERPGTLAVVAIGRTGEAIVEFALVAVRTDGAAVASMTVVVRVDTR